jgi:hypothetical protein
MGDITPKQSPIQINVSGMSVDQTLDLRVEVLSSANASLAAGAPQDDRREIQRSSRSS